MEITEKRVTFSGPESSVDMEVMRGFDGKPVKVLNLPNPAYQDYTQYRSVVHPARECRPPIQLLRHQWFHFDDGRGEQILAARVKSLLSTPGGDWTWMNARPTPTTFSRIVDAVNFRIRRDTGTTRFLIGPI